MKRDCIKAKREKELTVRAKIKTAVFCAAATLLLWQSAARADWDADIGAGEAAYKAGNNDVAEERFKKALVLAEKFGADDPRLAATLNDMGIIYDESKRFDEAESVYNRALKIREKAFGPDHKDVATTLNNLANLYKDEKKYADAEPLYKRVLDIYARKTGSESKFMAMAYHNLGSLYSTEGNTKEAITAFKKALQAGDKSLGPDNSHVVDIVAKLAQAYDRDGNKQESKLMYKRYLSSVSNTLGLKEDDPKTNTALKDFASSLRRDGQAGNADLIEKALSYQ